MKYVLLFLALCAFACTSNKYAGVPEKYHALLDQALAKAGANAPELEKALAEAPANQKEGMAFLIAYMPERDLLELKADFLLENAADRSAICVTRESMLFRKYWKRTKQTG